MSRPVSLVVCINEKLGAGQRSCVGNGSIALISQLEAMIVSAKLDVPVVRRECLGRCAEGPAMRIAPAGPFFTEIDETGLGNILDQLKSFIKQHGG
jgi:(2Fe-2S) ferredoxin